MFVGVLVGVRSFMSRVASIALLVSCFGCADEVGSTQSLPTATSLPQLEDMALPEGDTSPDMTPTLDEPPPAPLEPDMKFVEPEPPRCADADEDVLSCSHETELLLTGLSGFEPREVHWQVPTGTPPEGGWPAVMVFQGSLFSSEYSWESGPGASYGAYNQTRMIAALLESGYAVIAPEAHYNGSTYWDTNIAPWAYAWESSSDHRFILEIFEEIEDGTFGEINPERLYATGISSGGYMTSRMAVSYPGRFKALAIASASYATCAGYICYVPGELPFDHPPTLFLHGELDSIVPSYTMEDYAEELAEQEIPTRQIIDEEAGHEWLEATPEAVTGWFDSWQ